MKTAWQVRAIGGHKEVGHVGEIRDEPKQMTTAENRESLQHRGRCIKNIETPIAIRKVIDEGRAIIGASREYGSGLVMQLGLRKRGDTR